MSFTYRPGAGLRLRVAKGLTGSTGATGATPDFEIGTVTTLDPGQSATASITGTAENPVLNLGIPEGLQGEQGIQGETGPQGPQGDPGTMGGTSGSTDNAIIRADGTGGSTLQSSAVTIADSTGVIAGTQGITFSGTSSGTTSLVATAAASGTITLPAATDTLVGKATTDTLTNKTLVAPALGTPASGTLTNCTGLPVAGITASTSTALGVGSIELGHASDTTISRSASGVIAVEGVDLYPNIPQNSQSTAYTAVLGDANKHLLHPTADNNARTFTIPANSSVAYPIGTTLTFINEINTMTISITTDTLKLAGSGSTGSRTLAANGIATAIKTASTTWWISGTGLT